MKQDILYETVDIFLILDLILLVISGHDNIVLRESYGSFITCLGAKNDLGLRRDRLAGPTVSTSLDTTIRTLLTRPQLPP